MSAQPISANEDLHGGGRYGSERANLQAEMSLRRRSETEMLTSFGEHP